MINVCCALILKESKILAVQRGPESSHPWQWEFPGGKIQPGESARQGIIREIREELTVGIHVVKELVAIEFDYGEKQIRLIPFVCQIDSGEIELTEHIGKQWFDIETWDKLDWSGADRELIFENKKILEKIVTDKLK